MTEPHNTEGTPTVTVRMDSELVRLARIVCATRVIKLVDYLDSIVREQIIADHEALRDDRRPTAGPTRPGRRKRGKGDPEGK
jgi:hypothetical protein